MKKTIVTRIASLLTVKSIVTLVLTAVFAALSVSGVVSGSDFLTVFLMVISFYFGTQSEKIQSAIKPTSGGDNE